MQSSLAFEYIYSGYWEAVYYLGNAKTSFRVLWVPIFTRSKLGLSYILRILSNLRLSVVSFKLTEDGRNSSSVFAWLNLKIVLDKSRSMSLNVQYNYMYIYYKGGGSSETYVCLNRHKSVRVFANTVVINDNFTQFSWGKIRISWVNVSVAFTDLYIRGLAKVVFFVCSA